MNKLDKKGYEACIKRGVISKETTYQQFVDKIFEEFIEFGHEVDNNDTKPTARAIQELSDLKTAITNTLIHFGHDPSVIQATTIESNLNRRD